MIWDKNGNESLEKLNQKVERILDEEKPEYKKHTHAAKDLYKCYADFIHNRYVANLVEHKTYKEEQTRKKAMYIIKNLINFNHNYGHDKVDDENGVEIEKIGVSGDGENVAYVLKKMNQMNEKFIKENPQ